MRQFVFLLTVILANVVAARGYELNGHAFTLPDGFRVEYVAGPPLVNRPVSADFDERGRLYVTDSSGSNEAVEVQREQRPHRVVRLEDSDGDGTFDKRTVYADKLMFPEGSLWFDGSLYVAAPPEIWKFTDADDDGVAEQREVWFDGKTLTHCANDLHGPYLGPDGWIYWCKGAFADQTYERPGKSAFETRAAHIFRRRPEGGLIEHVMTGGMDNPVEVVFTPGGERIFSTTFLTRPGAGKRDGIIHAVYGGVYGKTNGALDGHPRTGNLMPVLDHLGSAAPCGLVRLDSGGLGDGFRNNVLTTLFNMHKVTRHVLTKQGATFSSATTDFLVSDNLDFHPTDVLEDADGSILVVDTGGWFRLCCPTSQLEKPDVLGGIYRIRKDAAPSVADHRGIEIAWDNLSELDLAELLNDERSAVRRQAGQRIAKRAAAAIPALREILIRAEQPQHRLQAVWALTRINHALARAAVQTALADADDTVRQAALHSISVWRDEAASGKLTTMVANGPAHNRRAAAEALGRVGVSSDVPRLLAAIPAATLPGGEIDRVLEHALIYAVIEVGDVQAVRKLISKADARVQRAALIALDQMEGSDLQAADIQPLLLSNNVLLSEAAWWIVERHPDWGESVVDALGKRLDDPNLDVAALERLGSRLSKFSESAKVQTLMVNVLKDTGTREAVRLTILGATSGQSPLPRVWAGPLGEQLSGTDAVVRAALSALGRLKNEALDDATGEQLRRITMDKSFDPEVRLLALNLSGDRQVMPGVFEFVCSQLDVESDVATRALAVDFLMRAALDQEQLLQVASHLPRTGVMELRPLLKVFAKSKDGPVGAALVEALLRSPAATALFPDDLKKLFAGFGEETMIAAQPMLAKIADENQNKLARIGEILALLPSADARRGLRVFQSAKSSCIACHQRGYIGGNIGPDLNGIGKIRSERDLLESILFPSLSFVRSYEPIKLLTSEGRVISGLIREETKQSITLQTDTQTTVQVPTKSIEDRQFGTVSIMPAGLEKQLSKQELADLVMYLKQNL